MVQTALQAVTPGGKVVQVGLGEEVCSVPTMQIVFKEVEYTGSWLYTNTVTPQSLTSCFTCSDALLVSKPSSSYDQALAKQVPSQATVVPCLCETTAQMSSDALPMWITG